MFRQVCLVLLLAVDVSAFIGAPRANAIHKAAFTSSRKQTTVVSVSATENSEAAAAAESASEGGKPSVDRERFTLFVGNLPFTATINSIRDIFATKGEVVYVNLPRDKDSRQARGFAFVDMASKEALTVAMEALNGYEIDGRAIRVTESLPREKAQVAPKKTDTEAKKLYVGNFPFATTTDELKAYFGQYGTVKDVYMPMNRDGTPRGFAFVTMKDEDVEKALEATNGVDFQGRPMVVSIPLPPGEKLQRKESSRTKLYIGNLSFYTVSETLVDMFAEFGTVHDCYLPEDPVTGSSRGFGFVTMDRAQALQAVTEMDGCEVDGRIIRVNEALPKGGSRASNDEGENP